MAVGSGRHILEIGSGTGRDARELEARGCLVQRSDAVAAFVDGIRREGYGAGGILAFTLKEGDGEEWTSGKVGLPRFFTYWRAAELSGLLTRCGWKIRDLSRVPDGKQSWLYVLCERVPPAMVEGAPIGDARAFAARLSCGRTRHVQGGGT